MDVPYIPSSQLVVLTPACPSHHNHCSESKHVLQCLMGCSVDSDKIADAGQMAFTYIGCKLEVAGFKGRCIQRY